MLATTLVATHSHSPWSSLPRARICRVPPGSVLCLLLLGFPTLGKEPGEEREQNKTKHDSEGGRGAGRGGSGDTKLPARPRGHRRPPGRDPVSPVAARQPVPPFSRGPGGATREACVREADARHSRTSGKPHGARADTEPCAGAQPPASKAETAAGKVHQPPPANTLRGEEGTARRCPKCQQGPHGDMGGWRAWRCPGALQPSGKMDLVTTHVYAHQPSKSHVVLSPLELFFTPLPINSRTQSLKPGRMSRGACGIHGLCESFKGLVSAGGVMGSEGACFWHLYTQHRPSQPQMDLRRNDDMRRRARRYKRGKAKIRWRKRLKGQQVLSRSLAICASRGPCHAGKRNSKRSSTLRCKG